MIWPLCISSLFTIYWYCPPKVIVFLWHKPKMRDKFPLLNNEGQIHLNKFIEIKSFVLLICVFIYHLRVLCVISLFWALWHQFLKSSQPAFLTSILSQLHETALVYCRSRLDPAHSFYHLLTAIYESPYWISLNIISIG